MVNRGSLSISGAIPVGVAAVLTTLITSCAPRTRLGPLETSHPASAEAPEAPVVAPAGVLRGASVAGTAGEPAPEMPQGHGAMHGGGGTTGHGAAHGGGEP
jgi:hypothetical protein